MENRRLDLLSGQILVSIKDDEDPFTINANDSIVTANDGSIDIKISGYNIFVTVTEGMAAVASDGEEKKVYEGRQLKITTGGEPVKVDTIINWAKELQKLMKYE